MSKKVQPTLAHFNFQRFIRTPKGTDFEVKIPNFAKEKNVVCCSCKRKFSNEQYLKQHKETSKKCSSSIAFGPQQETLSVTPCSTGTFRATDESATSTAPDTVTGLHSGPKEKSKLDKGTNKKQQSGKRRSYTMCFKAKVIKELNNLPCSQKGKLQIIANLHHVSRGLVCKWKKDEAKIMKAWEESRSKLLGGRRQNGSRSTRSRRKIRQPAKSRFQLAEEKTKEELLIARGKGAKVGDRWIRTRMRKYIRKFYGNKKADSFRASPNWMFSFKKRHGISLRRKTNKKKQGSQEMLPVIQAFHQQLRRDLNSCRRRTNMVNHKKWGRWVPERRFNVDQVPLPFVVDQGMTYELKGSTSVWISQPASGLDRRQCTLQLCIQPTEKQNVPPAIIFRGKGNVKPAELQSYDKRVHIYWQDNGWMDSAVATQWVKNTFAPAIDKSQENVLFLDNLSCQCTQDFHSICRKEANTLAYPLPPSVTDKLQPVDAGEGYMIKKLIGCQLDSYLENDENFERWCGQGFSASERRILLTKWVGQAWNDMQQYKNFRQRLFQKTGLLMTAEEGEEDKLINPQGYKDYKF